jgi:hypothetical protein
MTTTEPPSFAPPVCEVCLLELERRVEALGTGTGGLLCPHRAIAVWVWCRAGALRSWTACHPTTPEVFEAEDAARNAEVLAALRRRATVN